jgi:hypothetical protein
MKRIILLLIVAGSFCFLQAGMMTQASPARFAAGSTGVSTQTFSDTATYNPWAHDQNPLGLFETEDNWVSLKLNYHLLKLDGTPVSNSNNAVGNRKLDYLANNFIIPDLLVGKPSCFYFGVRYSLNQLAVDSTSKATLPLNRFGFTIIGQTKYNLFQIGLSGDGFYGEVTTDRNVGSRVVMGVESLGAYIGSQLHELFRLQLWSRAIARFDSLKDVTRALPYEDRFYDGTIVPLFGGGFDLGKPDFPVRSNFGLDIGRKHFVYVVKPEALPAYGENGNGNKDPITTDTLRWEWKTSGRIPIGASALSPAFDLGFWRAAYQRQIPTADNNPDKYEGIHKGFDWKFTDLHFGLGLNIDLSTWSTVWFEYNRQNMNLTTGDSIILSPDIPNSRGYNRFGFGLLVPLHGITAWSFPRGTELTLRISGLIATENPVYGVNRTKDFTLLCYPEPKSQISRYEPANAMKADVKVTSFDFGFDAGFLEHMFLVGASFAVINQESDPPEFAGFRHAGIEVGVDLRYNLRKP